MESLFRPIYITHNHRPHERVVPRHPKEADVVLDHHQIANMEIAIQTPRSIRENDHLDSKSFHKGNRNRSLGWRVSLIKVISLSHANAGNTRNRSVVHREPVVSISYYTSIKLQRKTVRTVIEKNIFAKITTLNSKYKTNVRSMRFWRASLRVLSPEPQTIPTLGAFSIIFMHFSATDLQFSNESYSRYSTVERTKYSFPPSILFYKRNLHITQVIISNKSK